MPKAPEDIIRDEIRAMSGYRVPDATGMVKLDAMENPYHLPPELQAEIARIVETTALNRYPDSGAARLKVRLREVMEIPAGADVLVGNGSDEFIQTLMLSVARPGACVLVLEPSFIMFRLIATFCGVRFIGVPLKPDFTVDIEGVLAAVAEHQPPLIFIVFPNNPTGNLFDVETIARIIEAAPGIVVLDEAYHAFAGQSFMPRLQDFPNLLVMRTLSKLGLAGLRLGVLAGARAWLQHVDKVRLPYNVNVLTQLIAEKVLQHQDVLARQAAAIKAERARLFDELEHIPGVRPFPSDANFILFRIVGASEVFAGLKRRGVLIKNLHETHPALAHCLRVTVGTPDENSRFLGALKETVNAG
ncbi:MAG: histidinol-phosphate transaminase [Betaproteobacteria bacterium]|nr:histidinol-phosphate transaminase [Betaproteobacteria bacterium]